jgi:hypothetical protein
MLMMIFFFLLNKDGQPNESSQPFLQKAYAASIVVMAKLHDIVSCSMFPANFV